MLVSFIRTLGRDEQIDLVALMGLGRGDATLDDWADLRAEAEQQHNDRTASYLLGEPFAGRLPRGRPFTIGSVLRGIRDQSLVAPAAAVCRRPVRIVVARAAPAWVRNRSLPAGPPAIAPSVGTCRAAFLVWGAAMVATGWKLCGSQARHAALPRFKDRVCRRRPWFL